MMFARSLLKIPRIAKLAINSGRQINKRSLHVTAIPFEKKYQHGETEFVYKFIQSYEAEAKECKQIQNELKFQEDLSGKASDDFVEAFEALSYYCANKGVDVSSDDFDAFVANFVKQVPTFNDDQLFKVLSKTLQNLSICLQNLLKLLLINPLDNKLFTF